MANTLKKTTAPLLAAAALAVTPMAQAKEGHEQEKEGIKIEQVDKTSLEKGAFEASSGFRRFMSGVTSSILWLPRKTVDMVGGLFHSAGDGVSEVSNALGDEYVGPTAAGAVHNTVDITQETLNAGLNIAEDAADAVVDLTARATIEAPAQVVSGKPLDAARNLGGAGVKTLSTITGSTVENSSRIIASATKGVSNTTADATTNLVERPAVNGVTGATETIVEGTKKLAKVVTGEDIGKLPETKFVSSLSATTRQLPDITDGIKHTAHELGSGLIESTGSVGGNAIKIAGQIGDAAIRGEAEKMARNLLPMMKSGTEILKNDITEAVRGAESTIEEANKLLKGTQQLEELPQKTTDTLELLQQARVAISEHTLKATLRANQISTVVDVANDATRADKNLKKEGFELQEDGYLVKAVKGKRSR